MHGTPAQLQDIALRLCEAGVTPTRQRLAVAAHVLVAEDHPSADEVWERSRVMLPTLAQATVYNTLHRLVEAGLLTTIQRPQEPLRYDPRTEPHPHLLDTATGLLTDLDPATVHVHLSPELTQGLDIRRVHVLIEGRRVPAS
jgi:Fur family peroxide stress response transcriptional regulator